MAFKAKDKGRPTEENEDMVDEAKAESEDAEKGGEEAHGGTERKEMKEGEELKRGGRHKRARGGHVGSDGKFDAAKHHEIRLPHHARKRGGHVPGMETKMRPDKRARGGATSDLNPFTAAGKMSSPDYEHQAPIPNGQGSKGGDNKGKNG